MKEKLLNNIGIKILSLILATMFWIIIVNIEDPITQKKFTVSVEILNASAVNSKDKVYEVLEGETVEVYAKGKTSIIRTLSSGDFRATADLADLTPPWTGVKIWLECQRYDNLSSASFSYALGKINVLKVALEDRVTSQFPVKVITTGTVEQGYALGSQKVKPNMINISGAESQIEKIEEVRVSVDVSGASKTIKRKVVPKAYDKNGKEINSAKLEFGMKEVMLTIDILETRTVPIIVNTVGEPISGYQCVQIDYDPKKVEIAGSADVLNNITSVPIDIDITNAVADVEKVLSIGEYLVDKNGVRYDDIKVPEGASEITIKVSIRKLSAKELHLTTDQISIHGLTEGYQLKYDSEANGNLVIRIAGIEEDLKDITVENLKPFIDLNGQESGSHVLNIQFDPPKGISIATTTAVTFEMLSETITEAPTKTPIEATEEPTSTPLPTVEPTEKPEETIEPTEEPEVTIEPTEEPDNLTGDTEET